MELVILNIEDFEAPSDNNFKYVSGCCDDLMNEGDEIMTELYKIDQDASNGLNLSEMQPKLYSYCSRADDLSSSSESSLVMKKYHFK